MSLLNKNERLAIAVTLGLALPLIGCTGSSAGGGAPEAESPPTLSIEAPGDGQVLNTTTPEVQLSFGGEPVLSSLEVSVDGVPVDLSDWIVFEEGASGALDPVPEGAHTISATISGGSGQLAKASVGFVTSTGGGATQVVGKLLDPDGMIPIVGAEIYLEEESANRVLTDATGSFVLEPTTAGEGLHLVFDPRLLSFQDGNGDAYVYPFYKRPVDLLEGATTQVDPCYLPKVYALVTFLQLEQQGVFSCSDKQFIEEYELTAPELGITLTIPQWTYVEMMDGADPCEQYLSITEVDKEHAPSNLPEGVDPPVLITVQPTGMKFKLQNGQLAKLPISFPNLDELAVGNEVDLFSVDHETGLFVKMGLLAVDAADPTRLVTIEGGLEGGSWHCSCPPGMECDPTREDGFEWCDGVLFNPSVQVRTGLVSESFPLPRRTLFDERSGMDLVYDSRRVVDDQLLDFAAIIQAASAVPPLISVQGELGKVPLDEEVWFSTEGISESATTTVSLPYAVDVDSFSSGYYPYQFGVTSHFPASSATTLVAGEMPIVRRTDGPFGAGWGLSGDDSIHASSGGGLMIEAGDGDVVLFDPKPLDLCGWTKEGPTNQGQWIVAGDCLSVTQTKNEGPTYFVSPTTITASTIRGSMRVANTDDDWIGFCFGYRVPLKDNGDDPGHCDFFRFRWARNTQNQHEAGHTLERCRVVEGEVEWEVLGTNHGQGEGWTPYTWHDYELIYEPGRIRISVDGELIFLITDFEYQTGRFAFYGQSQAGTTYTAIETSDAVRFDGRDGDFSTILKLDDGGYLRQLPDGTTERFGPDGLIENRIDRRGRMTAYGRDPQTGRLDTVTDPAGGVTSFSYLGARVDTISDPAGRVTRLEYTGSRLTAIEDATKAHWTYGYTANGLLTSTIDPDGVAATHSYDAQGRFTGASYLDGSTKELESVSARILQELAQGGTMNDPLPAREAGVEEALVRDALGRERTYSYTPAYEDTATMAVEHALTTERRRRWSVTFNTSDQLPLVAEVFEGPTGNLGVVSHTSFEWDHDRGLLSRSIRSALGRPDTADRIQEYAWDGTHAWLTGLTEAPGLDEERTFMLLRDGDGNVLHFVPPAPAGAVDLQYDPASLGALESISDATGRSVWFEREHPSFSATKVTAAGKQTELFRDGAGEVIAYSLNQGPPATFVLDELGRLSSVTDTLDQLTSYERSLAGRLVKVIDAKNPAGTQVFEYDERGRLWRWKDPLDATEVYDYWPDGTLRSVLDRNGNDSQFTYDVGGRLSMVEIKAPVGSDEEIALGYGDLDQLVSLVTEGSELAFTYTPFGELESEAELGAQPVSTVVYERDALGRPATLEVTVGADVVQSVTYGHDAAGRMTSLTDGISGTFAFQYDQANRRTALSRPGSIDTGYTHDAAGLLALVTTRDAADVILSEDALGYDAFDNVESIDSARSLLAPLDDTTTCVYDALQRLMRVDSDAAGVTNRYDPYDPVGNRRTDIAAYDLADRLVTHGMKWFAYDGNGNLVEEGSVGAPFPEREYDFSPTGRLVEVRQVDGNGNGEAIFTAAYDGLGRRIAMGDRRLVYAGDDLVAIVFNDRLERTILHGPGLDEPLAVVEYSGGQISRSLLVISDAQGSVIQHVERGDVVGELRYDAFGAIVDSSGDSFGYPTFHAYRGREHDTATGLYFNRARYYSPTYGRFISVDPALAGLVGSGVPSTVHPYTYGANNPYVFTDPFGEAAKRAAADRWEQGLYGVYDAATGVLSVIGAAPTAGAGLTVGHPEVGAIVGLMGAKSIVVGAVDVVDAVFDTPLTNDLRSTADPVTVLFGERCGAAIGLGIDLATFRPSTATKKAVRWAEDFISTVGVFRGMTDVVDP